MCCLNKKAIVSVVEHLTGEGMRYLNSIESNFISIENNLKLIKNNLNSIASFLTGSQELSLEKKKKRKFHIFILHKQVQFVSRNHYYATYQSEYV